MLRLKQVSKIYSSNGVISTGFSKVSLSFDRGEFIAITGESGSGKSTLLNVISGLDSYEEGEMYILDQPTSGFTSQEIEDYRKEFIGNIFQAFNLINSYTVYQNVELVLLMSGYDREQIHDRVSQLIEKVGLAGYEKTKASKLSGGQKQRVAIARALAKETPIIVADEPTGNLDVKSAKAIIQLLHEISQDKLVIIVTHNYEQVEPYVTRKIQMHDGRVVEDKPLAAVSEKAINQLTLQKTSESQKNGVPVERTLAEREKLLIEKEQRSKQSADIKKAKADPLTGKSMVRLAVRNTFNIPAKFFLLLLVFVFLWTGVVASYASTKNMLNVVENQGYNAFFNDIAPERYVVTKKDNSEFTEKDYRKLKQMDNISKIVKQDIVLDSALCITDGKVSRDKSNLYVNVKLDSIEHLNMKLVKGKMPKAANEAIYLVEKSGNDYMRESAEEMLRTEVAVYNNNNETKILDENLKVTGYGYTEQANLNEGSNIWVEGILYCSPEVVKNINNKILEQYSNQTLEFANKEIPIGIGSDTDQVNYILGVSEKVQKGQLLIPEEIAMYSNHPTGEDGILENESIYSKERTSFKIGGVYTVQNYEELLGIKNYDNVSGKVYMNPHDYNKLFDVGNYQSSIFVKDLKLKVATEKKLEAAGFNFLNVNDAKTTFEGDIVVSKILFNGSMIVTIVILFMICYFIIKLILKSRNSYFGIARMLGATRKNCNSLLRLEMFIVYNIAFIIGVGAIGLVKCGILSNDILVSLVNILTLGNMVLLYVVMSIMVILLANRYAKKMFKDSAMNAYREEV